MSAVAMQRFNITFADIIKLCQEGNHKSLVEKSPLDEVLLEMIITHHPSPDFAQKYRIPTIWKGDMESDTGKRFP